MGSILETALNAVVRDLRNTGGIQLDILAEPATDDPAYESIWLLAGREWRTGVLTLDPASHPLVPKLTKAGPSWCCPKSGSAISIIGELQQ